ncbi:MAG: response regulator transcription factor [Flavobacteriaceae bacterium]|nr:response regulator transcription factor [Flavobacteriaceae bacterium]
MNKIIRIAIADDHKLVRAGIAMVLKEHPNFLIVQQASNGQELLNNIKVTKPDVVLLDLEMPVLSGREALPKIHKINNNIKVLILTMHNNEAFIIQMMQLGANGYLMKDTDPKEVVTAINKVIESKYYFSDKISRALLQNISNPEIKLTEHCLSKREIDVLRLICEEHTTTEIGELLFLSPKTIEGYRKILMDKTGAKNMAGLVLFAVRHKLYTEIN